MNKLFIRLIPTSITFIFLLFCSSFLHGQQNTGSENSAWKITHVKKSVKAYEQFIKTYPSSSLLPLAKAFFKSAKTVKELDIIHPVAYIGQVTEINPHQITCEFKDIVRMGDLYTEKLTLSLDPPSTLKEVVCYFPGKIGHGSKVEVYGGPKRTIKEFGDDWVLVHIRAVK